jgi:hypothetical protein
MHGFAKAPKGYDDPSVGMRHSLKVARGLLWDTKSSQTNAHWLSNQHEDTFQLVIYELSNLQNWSVRNGATVFPSVELVEACHNTDVLDCVEGPDLQTTYPSLLIGLPRDARIIGPITKTKCNYIIMNIYEGREIPIVMAGKKWALKMPLDRFAIVSSFWDDGGTISASIPLGNLGMKIRDVINDSTHNLIRDPLMESIMGPEHTKIDEEETKQNMPAVISLMLNLVMLMQTYPKYIQKMPNQYQREPFQSRERPVTVALSRVTNLKDLTVKRIAAPSMEMSQGTRSSAMVHWRRGHWRRQRHGPDWQAQHPDLREIKSGDFAYHMVWIEPVLVGKGT